MNLPNDIPELYRGLFHLRTCLVQFGKTTYKRDDMLETKQMMQQIAIFAIVTFLLGASTPNTDNYGHLGGFLGGLGVAYALRLSPLYAGHPFFTRAAQACLFLTIAAFTLSIAIPAG